MLLRGCGQWYRCGKDRVARPSEQENLDPRPQRNRRRQEDVSKGEPSRGETSLHSRSSDLTSELQSSVRSDEVAARIVWNAIEGRHWTKAVFARLVVRCYEDLP